MLHSRPRDGERVLRDSNVLRKLRGSSDPAPGVGGQTDEWCERIRRQLTQILASPAFRNSRRNSDLLKYLVERTVEGKTEELKERNIGVDVFARTAEYDTATDHVVRSAASEIRKRLAQYYLEFGQEADITVDLYPVSYIPQFGLRREGPRDATDGERQETPIPKTADARPGSRPLGTWLVLFAVFCAGAVLELGVTLFSLPPVADAGGPFLGTHDLASGSGTIVHRERPARGSGRVQVGWAFGNLAVLPDPDIILIQVAAIAVLTVLMRVGIHHVLIHEASEDSIGAPRVCAHCSHLVPTMSFCPQCGVADRAIARPRRGQLPRRQSPPESPPEVATESPGPSR